MIHLKELSLSELRRVAEQTRLVKQRSIVNGQSSMVEVVERVPWRVWYVAAGNGDVIAGEEVVTIAVELGGPGVFPSRYVQFTASGQIRRLRDCCILRANDSVLISH